MSKKNKKPAGQQPDVAVRQEPVRAKDELAVETKAGSVGIFLNLLPYVVIMLCSLALYANTFKHQYALDDEIVISKNEYVLRGIAGLPDIFSKDLFDSFYKQMNTTAQLAGGRYRPLAVASFALEQEFLGTRQDANFPADCWDFNKNGIKDKAEDINQDGNWNDKDYKSRGMGMRHVNNAIFYGLAVCMLFLFLSRFVFRQNKLLCMAISLLFLFHPIHTEVVANVKSRDEIFSFLFMILTLYTVHRYALHRTVKFLVLTCLCFFCALLSKEYGVVLFFLVPLSLYLFDEGGFKVSAYYKLIAGMVVTFVIYYGIRSTIVVGGEGNIQEGELLNNPFLLADEGQKLATKLFIFLKYFLMLIFPHPLSSDYGYNSIPYKDFSDFRVWAAILFLFGCFAAAYYSIRKRHWSAFAIGFYLLTILLVTNLVFNIGATMGERLVFHASLGYCMGLGFLFYWLSKRFNLNALLWICLLPVLGLYAFKTVDRNKAWKNDISLALTDVEVMPESTALNGNAASRNLDLSEFPVNKARSKEYIRKAIGYAKKSVSLHPQFVNGYLNLGLAYAKLEQLDSAKYIWDIAFKIYPHHPMKPVYFKLLSDSYYQKGRAIGQAKNWAEGKIYLQKAVELNPENAMYWYDLGGFAFNAMDYITAKQAWAKAYQLAPNDPNIQKVQGLIP